MKDVLEGSTRSRLILVAFALVSLVLLALMITKEESKAIGENNSSVAGVTAALAGYQGMTTGSNGVVAVAASSYLSQDEAALGVNPATETELAEAPSPQADTATSETEVLATEDLETPALELLERTIPPEERDTIVLLARLIETESGGMRNLDERIAVGLTVFYRAYEDPNYPDDIEDNIYKKNQYAKPAQKASDGSLRAAISAYQLYHAGRGAEVLPPEYESFFGWKGHNYFYDYDNKYQIYEGLIDLPSGIKDAQRQIIPELH